MSLKGVPKTAEHRAKISKGLQTIADEALDRLLRVAAENCTKKVPTTQLSNRFGLSAGQIRKILKKHNVIRPTC